MPLHREKEALALAPLERLDDAVFRRRDNTKGGCDAIRRLMVTRSGHQRRADDRMQLRISRNRKNVRVEQAAMHFLVHDETMRDAFAEDVGHVLVERATECDVRDLQSTANGKRRQLLFDRRSNEGNFVIVARRCDRFRSRVGCLTVPGRVQIVPAG
jgi:hypothetical protein